MNMVKGHVKITIEQHTTINWLQREVTQMQRVNSLFKVKKTCMSHEIQDGGKG